MVSHDKEDDLVKFREEIQKLLEAEISSRYYLASGEIESSLRYDNDVNQAIKVLNDKILYSQFLAIK
jgi:carboxyl-terminal processing protease